MRRIFYTIVCLALAVPGVSQERPFCGTEIECPPGQDCCSDDILKVHFGSKDGPSTIGGSNGDTINAVFTVDVKSEGIQGWSYAAKHDTSFLTIQDVSFENADFLSEFSGGFNVSVKAFGCAGGGTECPNAERTDADRGVGQAVVLSFVEAKVLPTGGELSLLFATYTVTGDIPDGSSTKIEFVQSELATASGGPPVDVNLTVSGATKVPMMLVDGQITGPVAEAKCNDNFAWGFFFGTNPAENGSDAGGTLLISQRNAEDASAFELAVKNEGGSLSFVSGEIGDGEDNLRELIITDASGVSHTDLSLNTGSISDEITKADRASATEETDVQDFFVVQLAPLVGEGLFAGYVADLTAAQTKVLPATGNPDLSEGCPVNEIITLTIGGETLVSFSRGDVNADDKINVTDAVVIVKDLFGGDNPGIDCDAAYDSNADNALDINDAIFLLNWIFRRGERPAEPFLRCGTSGDNTLPCAEECA